MSTLDEWLARAQHDLNTELDMDVTELLDVTKTIAHNVARPAAPLGAFLIGYAAALSGGGAAAVSEAVATTRAAAEQWGAERPAKDDL